jgi:phosphatidylglycerophosphatase A
VLTRLAVFVCTFAYIGYFPVAPGTVGSVAGLVLYAVLRWVQAPPAIDAVVIALLFGIGVWSGTHAERYFGSTDPGPGVIDEVVGMLITLFMLPATWGMAIAGFFVSACWTSSSLFRRAGSSPSTAGWA